MISKRVSGHDLVDFAFLSCYTKKAVEREEADGETGRLCAAKFRAFVGFRAEALIYRYLKAKGKPRSGDPAERGASKRRGNRTFPIDST